MERNKKPKPSSKPKAEQNFLKYTSLAFEILTLNLLIFWGGYKLDHHLANEFPWFIVTAVFVSLGATIFYLLRRVQ